MAFTPQCITWIYSTDKLVPFGPASDESITDLTGASLIFSVSKRLGDVNIFTTTAVTITTATAGAFEVGLTKVQSQTVSNVGGAGLYRFVVQTTNTGAVNTLREGYVSFLPNIG